MQSRFVAVALALTLAVTVNALAPATRAQADEPLRIGRGAERQASLANWIIAGALTGVAVFSITSSVYTGLQSGTCIGTVEPDGRCTDRVDFGWRSVIFVSIGVTSLLTATFFVLMQPIRFGGSAGPDHAMLRLDTTF